MKFNIPDKFHLTVYDIPGLNDAKTKDIYFQYIRNKFNIFDVIILMVDI